MDHSITVVVPTLNSERTLASTLLSLTHQNDCSIRIIVVDSGSNDRTKEICDLFKIETLYVPPGNIYTAINAGLRLADTPWVSYLNSDDYIYPNSFARLIKLGELDSSGVVYGRCDYIDIEGRFIYSYEPGYPKELNSQFCRSQLSFAQPASIFRKEIYKKLGGFNEEMTLAADLDFFWRALLLPTKFSFVKGPSIACFRISSNQLSQNRVTHLLETKQIQQRLGKPSMFDYKNMMTWRFRNLPHYILRIVRRYLLSGKWQLVKSMDIHEDINLQNNISFTHKKKNEI